MTAVAPFLAPAPLCLAHEDENEHGSNRQEKQFPVASHRAGGTWAMRQRWRNQHPDLSQEVCRNATANTAAWRAGRSTRRWGSAVASWRKFLIIGTSHLSRLP